MSLKYPWLLLLFLIYVPVLWWYVKRHKTFSPSLGISSLSAFSRSSGGWKLWVIRTVTLLQFATMGLLIVALCRPQTNNSMTNSRIEGTDIVLALDISGSMEANDLMPNRFAAAKETAMKFVQNRPDDNIGLVIFSGEALSIMPLTNDRNALVKAIDNIQMGMLGNGTAIGDGLTSSINRVISGKAKSKSIILLTDGTNNSGDVAPSTAADIAAGKKVKVYTIGVGTDGVMQVTDPYGMATTTLETRIDEDALRQIAERTNGRYFRATDSKMLQDVFAEIDSLEKTKMDVERYSRMDENFMPWVMAALCCYALAMLLSYTILRKIP